MKETISYVAIVLGLNFAAVTMAWTADNSVLLNKAREYFAPLPKTMATAQRPLTPTLVELGRALFFDPRMSVDGTTSRVRVISRLFTAPTRSQNHMAITIRSISGMRRRCSMQRSRSNSTG